MSSKEILTFKKLNSIKESFRNPKNVSDVSSIEDFNKIVKKTLEDTAKEEAQLKDKSKIPSKKDLCQFLQDEFSQSQLVDIIVELHKILEDSSWNPQKETNLRESLKDKSSHQYCQIIKKLCPDLMNPFTFNFFKNYLKNIKLKHVIGSLVVVSIVGGFMSFLWSARSRSQTVVILRDPGERIKYPNFFDYLKNPFQTLDPQFISPHSPLSLKDIMDNLLKSRDVMNNGKPFKVLNPIPKFKKFGNSTQALLTYLSAGILGTFIPSAIKTFKEKVSKMGKKYLVFINAKKRNLSIKKAQSKIDLNKKKSLKKKSLKKKSLKKKSLKKKSLKKLK